jgi:hypothetical protein
MSDGRNASGAFSLLLFPDVKFLTSSLVNNKFMIDPHQGIASG